MYRSVDGTTLCTVHDGLAALADVLVSSALDESSARSLASRTLADHPAAIVLFVLPDSKIVAVSRDGVTLRVRLGQSLVDDLALALHTMWSVR
jgi:hypothetical protein